MSRALRVQDSSKNQLEQVQKDSIHSPIDSQVPCDVLASLLADKRSYLKWNSIKWNFEWSFYWIELF